jgi:hypothetical protein
MKRWSAIVGSVVAGLVTAAPVGAGDATTFTTKHNFAAVDFQSTDPSDECIFTEVIVTANQELTPPGTAPAASAGHVDILRSNVCTESPLPGASGEAELPAGAFAINPSLSTASLVATIPVSGGLGSFPVDVNVTFTGIDLISRGPAYVYKIVSPECKLVSHVDGTRRNAATTGTVIGNGENFTPEPGVYGEIGRDITGTIQIGCT